MSESAPPFSFDCHRCGNCCRVGHGQVWFEPVNLPSMAKAVGIDQEAFLQRFVRSVNGRLSLRENPDGSCTLLDGNEHCSIYEVRPKQCRDFPYWPQLSDGSRALELAAGYCQGIQQYPNRKTLHAVLPQAARFLNEVLAQDLRASQWLPADGERWGSSIEVDLYLATAEERRILKPSSLQEVRQWLEALSTESSYPWSVGPWERILADRRAGWMASGGLPTFTHEF
ncbi:MAG: YkgJ family cysteine cluster protein [Planctomycetota bacterium]|nr:YkgJ family cysteine cluster protein [Planctomycetota bacterium]MDA1112718.1 YkgJ family cysteine cluster protein [Planctomycetota bacterium]